VNHPLLSAVITGITIHIITGISIGIISGIFLYKTNILNISKPSNGLYYGFLTGTPIRTFCNRSRFYCAGVESIDLENKSVEIRSSLAPVIHSTQISINSTERWEAGVDSLGCMGLQEY
jgi:hypothetical protein